MTDETVPCEVCGEPTEPDPSDNATLCWPCHEELGELGAMDPREGQRLEARQAGAAVPPFRPATELVEEDDRRD
jgi:hypothetical protein